jgi:hypothetical protein
MTPTLYAHMNIIKKETKQNNKKRTGGVVQGVGPEFKPQYSKKMPSQKRAEGVGPEFKPPTPAEKKGLVRGFLNLER